MKIRYLNEESNGTLCVEILCNEISYRSLLRCIGSIEGVKILNAFHDPMNDNARIDLNYFEAFIHVDTPFSDYLVSCEKPEHDQHFRAFIDKLEAYKVKFWHRLI